MRYINYSIMTWCVISASLIAAAPKKPQILKGLNARGVSSDALREYIYLTKFKCDFDKALPLLKRAVNAGDTLANIHWALRGAPEKHYYDRNSDAAQKVYTTHRKKLEALATKGNLEARFLKAVVLMNGRFTKKDSPKAIATYLALAKKGHMRAAGYYAWLTYKDKKKGRLAALLAKKAYEAGVLDGTFIKGKMLIEQSNRRARGNGLKLLQQAADRNHPTALISLGGHFQKKRNMSKALIFYEKGVRLGIPTCYAALGIMYLEGKGVGVDTKKGCRYLYNAVNGKSGYACYLMGYAFEYGKYGFKQDQDEAYYWYREGEKQNHAESEKKVKGNYSDDAW